MQCSVVQCASSPHSLFISCFITIVDRQGDDVTFKLDWDDEMIAPLDLRFGHTVKHLSLQDPASSPSSLGTYLQTTKLSVAARTNKYADLHCDWNMYFLELIYIVCIRISFNPHTSIIDLPASSCFCAGSFCSPRVSASLEEPITVCFCPWLETCFDFSWSCRFCAASAFV